MTTTFFAIVFVVIALFLQQQGATANVDEKDLRSLIKQHHNHHAHSEEMLQEHIIVYKTKVEECLKKLEEIHRLLLQSNDARKMRKIEESKQLLNLALSNELEMKQKCLQVDAMNVLNDWEEQLQQENHQQDAVIEIFFQQLQSIRHFYEMQMSEFMERRLLANQAMNEELQVLKKKHGEL